MAQSGKALKSDFMAADLMSSWLILDIFGALKSKKHQTEMRDVPRVVLSPSVNFDRPSLIWCTEGNKKVIDEKSSDVFLFHIRARLT